MWTSLLSGLTVTAHTIRSITRASKKSRVVLLRRARNRRLAEAFRWWAFQATQCSPRAKAYYQHRCISGEGREAVLRRLANALLGQLHHRTERRGLSLGTTPTTGRTRCLTKVSAQTPYRLIVANNGLTARGSRAVAGRRTNDAQHP
jgi:hypothetical protein